MFDVRCSLVFTPGIGKLYLCRDPAVVVSRYHLNCVVGKMEHLGLFGPDNMAGFDGLLHRVGVMRDKASRRKHLPLLLLFRLVTHACRRFDEDFG